MEKFIKALKAKQGFEFLTDYNNYSDLTKDDLRNIAKELIYAIECYSVGLLESEIQDIYKEVEENLTID